MPRSISKRAIYTALSLILLLAATTLIYSCSSSRAMRREVAEAVRDPESGVIVGTEAVTLGDESADTACLLLHGFVGSRIDFRDLGTRLSESGFRVRMTRLPGHGTTPEEFRRTSDEELLEAARSELKALRAKYDRVYVVGFSMGGAIATLLAAEEEIDRLVLISPYYGVTYFWYYVLPPEVWNKLLGWAIPYVKKGPRFVKVNRPEAKADLFSYKAVPTAGAATLGKLGKRAHQPALLEKVVSPLLVIHSRGDEAASPEATQRAFDLMGSDEKQIHWYGERSNHHILWDYDGEDAARRVVEFLSAPVTYVTPATPD